MEHVGQLMAAGLSYEAVMELTPERARMIVRAKVDAEEAAVAAAQQAGTHGP